MSKKNDSRFGNPKETREEEYEQQKREPIQMDGYESLADWSKKVKADLTTEEAIDAGVTIDEDGTVWVPPWIYVWCVIGETADWQT